MKYSLNNLLKGFKHNRLNRFFLGYRESIETILKNTKTIKESGRENIRLNQKEAGSADNATHGESIQTQKNELDKLSKFESDKLIEGVAKRHGELYTQFLQSREEFRQGFYRAGGRFFAQVPLIILGFIIGTRIDRAAVARRENIESLSVIEEELSNTIEAVISICDQFDHKRAEIPVGATNFLPVNVENLIDLLRVIEKKVIYLEQLETRISDIEEKNKKMKSYFVNFSEVNKKIKTLKELLDKNKKPLQIRAILTMATLNQCAGDYQGALKRLERFDFIHKILENKKDTDLVLYNQSDVNKLDQAYLYSFTAALILNQIKKAGKLDKEQASHLVKLREKLEYLYKNERSIFDKNPIIACRILSTLGNIFSKDQPLKEEQRNEKRAYYYRESVKLNPAYGSGYYNLSLIDKKEGRFEEALEHINKAINLQPDDIFFEGKAKILCELLTKEKESKKYQSEAILLLSNNKVVSAITKNTDDLDLIKKLTRLSNYQEKPQENFIGSNDTSSTPMVSVWIAKKTHCGDISRYIPTDTIKLIAKFYTQRANEERLSTTDTVKEASENNSETQTITPSLTNDTKQNRP
jgi:tetratricopeptide (TPR) repeat protein